jgi:hypothetical protein
MKFKYYDLMSHLVPGLVIYFFVDYEFKGNMPDISALPLLAITFIIGYFNNTISSWLEGFYRSLTGGNPVNKFFDGAGIWKVDYFNGTKMKELLKSSIVKDNPSNKELFVEAMRIANSKADARVIDFNASYAFSRGILTNMLFVAGILIYSNYTNPWYYIVLVSLLTVALLRYHQRGGYYIREVLNVCQHELETQIE